MPATPNPVMNSKEFHFFFNEYLIFFEIDAANDILYGLHQSRIDRNYSTNNNNNNNNNKSSEQDKLLNTSPIRTDLKLTVSTCFFFDLNQFDYLI
jgi:hypothetical protein